MGKLNPIYAMLKLQAAGEIQYSFELLREAQTQLRKKKPLDPLLRKYLADCLDGFFEKIESINNNAQMVRAFASSFHLVKNKQRKSDILAKYQLACDIHKTVLKQKKKNVDVAIRTLIATTNFKEKYGLGLGQGSKSRVTKIYNQMLPVIENKE